MDRIAFLFPGQGSQQVGMGQEFRSERPELFERYFALAEAASGLPISRFALEGPEAELTRTEIAQPALLALSLALHTAAREVGIEAEFMGGHSLGEYTAAVASGALGAEEGMRLVCERGRLMAEIQSVTPGTMAAVMGLGVAAVEQLCAEAGGAGVGAVEVANLNNPQQVVVSGEEAAVERVIELASAAGARQAVRLPVGAAFHSRMMEPVRRDLAALMDELSFEDPSLPIVSNASGELVRSAGEVRRALTDQIASAVLWVRCVETLRDAGVSRFIELGPGRVLSGLVRRIDRGAEAVAADSEAKLAELSGGR